MVAGTFPLVALDDSPDLAFLRPMFHDPKTSPLRRCIPWPGPSVSFARRAYSTLTPAPRSPFARLARPVHALTHDVSFLPTTLTEVNALGLLCITHAIPQVIGTSGPTAALFSFPGTNVSVGRACPVSHVSPPMVALGFLCPRIVRRSPFS